MQSVTLPFLRPEWLVVDIGGGNEGLAARAGGSRVCAVDIRMDKIREARIYHQSAQWICADGRRLCIQNASVDVVTLWFSLGYLSDEQDKRDVLDEAFRILRPGGSLSLLAIEIDTGQEALQFNANIVFADGEVSRTGFRISGRQSQTLRGVKTLLKSIGFQVTEAGDEYTWFHIWAVKP